MRAEHLAEIRFEEEREIEDLFKEARKFLNMPENKRIRDKILEELAKKKEWSIHTLFSKWASNWFILEDMDWITDKCLELEQKRRSEVLKQLK